MVSWLHLRRGHMVEGIFGGGCFRCRVGAVLVLSVCFRTKGWVVLVISRSDASSYMLNTSVV